MQGFYLKPKNNFTDLLHDPDVVGRGMEEGKGCLFQCSTNPNITCIIGRYDHTCPGHIHWGLVYFAVMLAFNGRSWP